MVKSGLKCIECHIDRIREALAWISLTTSRVAKFERACLATNKNLRMFGTNMEIRWNSTYLMLHNCIDYSEVITLFYNIKKGKGTIFLKDLD